MNDHLKKHGSIFLYVALIFIVLGYAALIIIKTWPIDVYSMDKAGLFGDSFGVITCFFTALGFIGLLINLKEQRTYNNKQAFESNFFQMLSHLNEITKDVEFVFRTPGEAPSTHYGKSAFFELANEFRINYGITANNLFFDETKSEKDKVEICYEGFWNDYGSKLGHYYRWLYNMLNFIDGNNKINKEFYVKLVTAQLSNQELLLMFYNASFKRGLPFQPFIKEYEMVSNLEKHELLLSEHAAFIPNVKFWGSI